MKDLCTISRSKSEKRRRHWFWNNFGVFHVSQPVTFEHFFVCVSILFLLFFFLTLLRSSFWTSRGHRCRPFFPPVLLPSIFIAHRVQQSHCSSIFHRVLLTHALALSASQFVHKKKSQRIYARMHSAGLELTKLTYTRLEYNLMRHQGDRHTRIAALLAIRSATALNNALIRDTPLRRIYYKYDAELTTNICRRYGPQHCTYFHSCCYSPATYTGRSCYPQQPSEHAHVVTGTMCQVHTGAYLVRPPTLLHVVPITTQTYVRLKSIK